MPDADHWYGQDWKVSPTGDIAMTDGIPLANQRIVRRLMTIIKGYVWAPTYGGSVPARIGDILVIDQVTAVVRSQMYLEASVSRLPEPTIRVTPITSGVFVSIQYVDALTGLQASLQFDVVP